MSPQVRNLCYMVTRRERTKHAICKLQEQIFHLQMRLIEQDLSRGRHTVLCARACHHVYVHVGLGPGSGATTHRQPPPPSEEAWTILVVCQQQGASRWVVGTRPACRELSGLLGTGVSGAARRDVGPGSAAGFALSLLSPSHAFSRWGGQRPKHWCAQALPRVPGRKRGFSCGSCAPMSHCRAADPAGGGQILGQGCPCATSALGQAGR